MEEIWKDIPGYEGHYQASNLGSIRRVKFGPGTKIKKKGEFRNMSGSIVKGGYMRVRFSKEGVRTRFLWHRIIMLAFKGASKLPVNHKDCNKLNNRISNLEYVTSAENMRHAALNNLCAKGETNGMGKLVNKEVRSIKYLLRKGNHTQREIACMFDVCASTIMHIHTGRTWRHIE